MLSILADENMPLIDELFAGSNWIDKKAGRAITRADLVETDVLLVRSVTKINQDLLAGTPVKFVGSATIGTDHVDLDYLQSQGIKFAHAPGCNSQAVAEYVLCAVAYWAQKSATDLKRITVGVIGAGNVGTQLSELLEYVGIDYILNDPILEQKGDTRKFVSLAKIQKCDVVTCHVPLTRTGDFPTKHLINEAFLKEMSSHSLFINTSRGGVLNNQDALKVHNWNHGLDLVLDVWENEPNLDPQLLDNCLLGTPHIAGYSLEGKIKGTYMLYQQFRQWQGKEVDVPVTSYFPKLDKWDPSYLDKSLHHSLQKFYDIEADDKALRQVKDNLSQEFDLLRKNYKTRIEYWR